jgi:hypothetical protein
LHVPAQSGLATRLPAFFALGGFSSTSEADLVQGVHFGLPSRFFFVRRFGELDDRVYAPAFAFAGEDLFCFAGCGRVRWERHYASDGGVAVDA